MSSSEPSPVSESEALGMTFPIEIFDHIIQIVTYPPSPPYDPDWKTLKALALTCRAFVPLCQRRIFSYVNLRPNWYKKSDSSDRYHVWTRSITIQELHELLTNRPEIADYVHVLSYSLHKSNFGDQMLLSLLKGFERLEYLTINYLPYAPSAEFDQDEIDVRPARQDWQVIPSDLKDTIIQMIQAPGLQSISLLSFKSVPPTIFLSLGPSINSVFMHDTHFTSNILPPSTVVDKNPLQLRLISCTTTANFTSLIQNISSGPTPLIDISLLQSFSVTITEEYDGAFVNELLCRTPHIQNLTISCFRYPLQTHQSMAQLLETIDRQALTPLKQLRLSCGLETMDTPFLPYTSLQRFTPMSSLRDLDLYIALSIDINTREPFREDLKKLDQLLVSSSFPVLRKVGITINTSRFSAAPQEEETEVLRSSETAMPLLSHSDNTDFEYQVLPKHPEVEGGVGAYP